jgi:formyl-CoA transferase
VFDGLRVVELGTSDAARYCGMLFSDFGATVLQVPDINESWQPHSGRVPDYLGRMADRGKYVAPAAQSADEYLQLVRRWIAEADVLIDGSAHGGLPAAGLTYEEVRSTRPELVVIGLSLTGRYSASAHLDGCELIAAARASDLAMTGMTGRPPTRSVSPKAEMYAAYLAFCGAAAKLRLSPLQRGATVDVAYADAMFSALEGRVEHFFESGRVARRMGAADTGYGVYRVKDGYVAIAVAGSNHMWRRYCELIERPELVDHPLLSEPITRRQYPELVAEALTGWIADRTRSEVVEKAQRLGVIAAAIQTLPEAANDPQAEAMECIVEGGDDRESWRCGGYPLELVRTPAVRHRSHAGQIGDGWPLPRVTLGGVTVAEDAVAQPLSGMLILDFGWGIANPHCTMILSDLGATVIKVEDPESAEGRFLNFCGTRRRNGVTETVLVGSYRDRNKQSMLADLRVPGAQAVIDRLVTQADALVTNVAPGSMERMGYGEDRMTALNPRLVYASISGFGNRGPLRSLRGLDLMAQAHSGFLSLTGFPEDPPTRSAQSWSDYLAGMALAAGVIMALLERERSGCGQIVRTSLLGVAMTTFGGILEEYLATGIEPSRKGNESQRFGVACAVWDTKDRGSIAIDVTAPAALEVFKRLRRAAGSADGEFDLGAELADYATEHTAYEGALRLQEAGVPAAVAGTIRDSAAIGDFWTRGMLLSRLHPQYGRLVMTGNAIRIDEQALQVGNAAPRPGADTERVLRNLAGLSDGEIAELYRSGAMLTGLKSPLTPGMKGAVASN